MSPRIFIPCRPPRSRLTGWPASAVLLVAWASVTVTGALCAQAIGPDSPQPTLRQVMARVGRYVQDYGDQLAVVIAVEQYAQQADKPFGPTRRLVSEIALVRLNDDWMGFRDVQEVDGKRIADRADRLRKLFTESPGIALEQGRRLADESARYNLGAIQRNFNTPTTTLLFMQASNQARFRFTKDREEQVDGVLAWRIRYEETQQPTLIRTPNGHNRPVKGTLWVNPIDGRVYRTDMEIDADSRSARDDAAHPDSSAERRSASIRAVVSVRYQEDPQLHLLVPAEMQELYVGPSTGGASDTKAPAGSTTITCRAVYTDFKRFETSGRLILPKMP